MASKHCYLKEEKMTDCFVGVIKHVVLELFVKQLLDIAEYTFVRDGFHLDKG
jgi:hypothetical protein